MIVVSFYFEFAVFRWVDAYVHYVIDMFMLGGRVPCFVSLRGAWSCLPRTRPDERLCWASVWGRNGKSERLVVARAPCPFFHL